MKRILSVLLTAAMLISMTLPIASAAGSPTLSISSGEVKAGETVTLTVSIEDNPGLAAALIYVYYDTSVFEVDPSRGVRASGTFRAEGGLIGNSISVAKVNGRYNGDANKDGVLALWYNNSGVNTTADGDMLMIALKAKEGAVCGSYTVGIGYSAEDTRSQTGRVPLTTVNGMVTLSDGNDVRPSEPNDTTDDSEITDDPDVSDDPEIRDDPEPTDSPEITDDLEATDSPESTSSVFPDIQGHWAKEYIERAAELELVFGNEYGMYAPDNTMTRAECVTLLWRACGSPKASKPAEFVDLNPKQTWYHEAVAWGAENGVINGVGNQRFDPLGTVSREQVATILFRMAGGKSGIEAMFSNIYNDTFSDNHEIANWAKQGVYWSIYNEIFCGENSASVGRKLNPNAAADRAQIAVMVVRYLEHY